MTQYLRTVAALAVSLMGSALVPALQADEWDKKTNITIDHSIDVQGNRAACGIVRDETSQSGSAHRSDL
jgi:hypothetical protein